MIRIVLPAHLQIHAAAPREVHVEVTAPVSQRTIIEALEAKYPVLKGMIREHITLKRRPLVRFFACQEDISQDPVDTPLPDVIATGAEAFYIVGAIAGG